MWNTSNGQWEDVATELVTVVTAERWNSTAHVIDIKTRQLRVIVNAAESAFTVIGDSAGGNMTTVDHSIL